MNPKVTNYKLESFFQLNFSNKYNAKIIII